MYAYSKIRRENANFKINTKVDSEGDPVYVADPSTGSDEPITGLLQILPKGLDCYDFLGVCVEDISNSGAKQFGVLDSCVLVPAGSSENSPNPLPVDVIIMNEYGIYIPSNGYLIDPSFDFSSLAPEGEGGNDGEEAIIVNPINPGGIPVGGSEA